MANIVKDKSCVFAIRIVKLYQYLTKEKREYILSKQLIRSGTSIGANVAEALASISRKEFLAKMYIAFKECVETEYWLFLLVSTQYITQKEYESIRQDCSELAKILTRITQTTRENDE